MFYLLDCSYRRGYPWYARIYLGAYLANHLLRFHSSCPISIGGLYLDFSHKSQPLRCCRGQKDHGATTQKCQGCRYWRAYEWAFGKFFLKSWTHIISTGLFLGAVTLRQRIDGRAIGLAQFWDNFRPSVPGGIRASFLHLQLLLLDHCRHCRCRRRWQQREWRKWRLSLETLALANRALIASSNFCD